MLEFRLETTATAQAARRLAKAAVAVVADSVGLPEVVHDFDLALTEACANVVRHAYPKDAPGPLRIVVRLKPHAYVEAEVVDEGKGPPCQLTGAVPLPEEEGGRGLFIIRNLMDSASLGREDGRTVIAMRKNVPSESWTCRPTP
ncbi:putative anti-sigma regulatory factor, serine/threonine protein kinase [Desulfovibrio sp. X2]|uniref:ATP-binding protein n=1 Tax=Desulfovibrio sp. X2 TaxID=941449 RepID=UPI000358F175|nr:ATP-binding protein [Desulfovibrio sp. X2]EPR43891.1 putative anti-sigma regulatory factor, serine/threonine protein kinase [Desulfovibrio sp. X2]